MNTPKQLSFLLVSDIHFGPCAFSPDFALADNPPDHQISGAVPMKASLIQALKEHPLSLLLISGDLTSTGSPSEFHSCKATMTEIADALGVQSKSTFFTFGNHDVDWCISRLSTGSTGKTDRLYHTVAGSVGCMFVGNPPPTTAGPVPGCATYEQDDFTLVAVNTGFQCSHDQAYRHGVVGTEQLAWLKGELAARSDDKRWHILLLHHHPQKYSYPTPTEDISCIEESSEVMDLIGNGGVDIVCHGHRHHPYLQTMMQTGWKVPVTFLCAGSLAVNEVERRLGEIPNVCHVVTLRGRHSDRAATGDVLTYKYISSEGWTRASYSREVPLDGRQEFGSIATEEQQRTDARDIISALTDGNGPGYIDLPNHKSLPLSLRALPAQKLNQLVKEVAWESFSRKVLGLYPHETVILRT